MIDLGGVIASPRTKHVYIGLDVLLRGTISIPAAPPAIDPSRYAIELRDKDGELKARLEKKATNVSFEWNRIGGCGRATLRIGKDYNDLVVSADDDLRIWLPDEGGGATLWYRGYVESVTPTIQTGNQGSITIECAGYFNWLDRLIVQDDGSEMEYTNTEVSDIVADILDTFVVGNGGITAGTIDPSHFTPDTISFKVSAREALRTLADLLGNVEYGIDANLEFFWREQSETVVDQLRFGKRITRYSDKIDYRQIVNKVYFEGGESSPGSVLQTSRSSASSIRRYGKHEEIVSNGSITTNSVANRFISSLFQQRGSPSRLISLKLTATSRRFEETLPMGAYAIVDEETNQLGAKYGTTANSGSNRIYGTTANGGSGQVYGGVPKYQIDRVQYTLSPMDGRIDADISFGTTMIYSLASASLKRIEQQLSAQRLRSI